jgi:ligand-binding sensor domain-containing protein/two-component sensor histidine kinase
MVIKKILFIICLLISLFGKAQQYTFIPYGVESGLAQSQVFAIEQDKYGYLWIGTLGGLSRFDGTTFKNYSIENGLLSNHITSILRLKNSNLVFAHPGGLTIYDGFSFTKHELPDSLATTRITCLTEIGNTIWFGTDSYGLFKLTNNVLEHLSSPLNQNLNIRDIKVFNNSILIASRIGMLQYDTNNNLRTWKDSVFKDLSCSGIAINKVESTVWVSTFGNGVYKMSGNKIENLNLTSGIISTNIRGLFLSSSKDIWLYTKIGVTKISEDGSIINLDRNNGLAYDNIFTVIEDREKNIWFGSDGGGIFKFTGTKFQKYTVTDGLASNLVMSIIQDNDSNYWFSTYGEGITKWNNQSSTTFNLTNGLGNNTIWSSLKTSNGELWFCSSDGVYIFSNNQFKKIDKKDGLVASRITAIFEDSKGRIWLGAREGVSIYDRGLIKSYDAWNGSVGTSVRCFIENKQGEVVLGTANGLYVYRESTFRPINFEGKWCDNIIQEIKVSENGWWIGTSNGLHFYDGQQMFCLRLNDNFSSNYINFIEIVTNQIWVGTNNGLFKIDEQDYLTTKSASAVRYTRHEGFSSLETNLHASYIDLDGNLWFGTADGVFKHTPSNYKNPAQVNPVVNINNVQLFLQNPDWRKKNVNIDPTTGLPTNLTVGFKDNYFTFSYTGLSFTNPIEVKYQFMLEGFDEQWLPPTKANFATYSNLPHGNFTFKVKCINKYGYESEIETFDFTITPPFWLTWWFYSFITAIIIIILLLLFQWRKNITQRKRQTQTLINQSKMLGLEQQTLNASMNRHFIFNSLNSIQYYINRQDKLAANKYLSRFAKLIRKNLDSSEETSSLLSDEIERLELYLSLELMRFKDKFEYKIEIDDEIEPDNIYVPCMLLQPFVENSIWHGILPSGKKGIITIKIVPEDSARLRIVIIDDGIGIDHSLSAKNEINNQHNSKGMKITKDRIMLLQKMSNLDLFISGPNEIKDGELTLGTKVEMVLPRENAQLYY